VGAVGVLAVPATGEVEDALDPAGRRADRVLAGGPVLEAATGPRGLGVRHAVRAGLRVARDHAQELRHRPYLALGITAELEPHRLWPQDRADVAVLAAAGGVRVRAGFRLVPQHRPEVRRLVTALAGGTGRREAVVGGEAVGRPVADVVVYVVGAVGHAGRHDEVVRVPVVLLVATAGRNEGALGGVAARGRFADPGGHVVYLDEVARHRAALVAVVVTAGGRRRC